MKEIKAMKSSKTKHGFRKALSVILALAMIFPPILSSAAAFAEFSEEPSAHIFYEGNNFSSNDMVGSFFSRDPLRYMVDIPFEQFEHDEPFESLLDYGIDIESQDFISELSYDEPDFYEQELSEPFERSRRNLFDYEAGESSYDELDLYEQEQDDGRTDRFIVRYI